MVSITRNSSDLAADERNVIERLVGKHLTDNQQIVVQVQDADTTGRGCHPQTAADYAILSDLSDPETAMLTDAFTRRSPSRDIPLQP